MRGGRRFSATILGIGPVCAATMLMMSGCAARASDASARHRADVEFVGSATALSANKEVLSAVSLESQD